MNQMMDWNPNGWIFLLIGGLLFLYVVLILLYFLLRNHQKEDYINNKEDFKIRTQNYRNDTSLKKCMEKPTSSTHFCPHCGEKLGDETSIYCPFCGSKI